MTISNTTRTAGPFIGNGVTQSFPFSYKVFGRGDVLVATTVAATGVETILTLDADYTVQLNSNQNANPGGTITLTNPLPIGSTLAATSNVSVIQSLDLTNNGGFYPDTINTALDRIVINIQQLAARVGLGALNVGASAQIAAVLAFISNLAASAGSSLVGHLQAGAGAVRRTLQDRLRERVSVKDFGALGNFNSTTGAGTDDTAAIQAALDYIKSMGGGILHFPPGDYKTTAPLLYNADGLYVRASPRAVLWPFACDAVKFGNPDSTTYTVGRRANITIENLQVNQTNAPGHNGLSFYNVDELKLKNTWVFYGAKGTYLKYTYNARLSNCVNILGTVCGLDMDGACDKTFISRGQYGNTGNGIIIRGGRGIVITGGTSIERNQLEGILLTSGAREADIEWPGGVVISGNYIERNCQAGGAGVIALGQGADAPDYCKGVVIEGNYLNWDAGNPASNATTPFICIGKCSEVTLLSNRYVNGTNYILLQANAYKPRIQLLDVSGEQAASIMLRSEIVGQLEPFNFIVPCDNNGFGAYDLNMGALGFAFTASWITLGLGDYTPPNPVAPATTVPTATITFVQIDPNHYTIKVRNGPISGNIAVHAVVCGKLI